MTAKTTDNKAFWSRMAGLYGPFIQKSAAPVYREVCAEISAALRPDMDVLELACGSGQFSFPLAEHVQSWEATDYSPEMIAQAHRKAPGGNLRFSVADAAALPYAPQTFDAVVIANALHILPTPEQAMAEIARVLKPGGLLFAPTFVQEENAGRSLGIRLISALGFRTCHSWNAGELLAFVSQNGFSVSSHRLLSGGLSPLCSLTATLSPEADLPDL